MSQDEPAPGLGEPSELSLTDLVPTEWGYAEGRVSLWVSCYRVYLAERDELARQPLWSVEGFGCKAVAMLGSPRYWHPGIFSIGPWDTEKPITFEVRDPREVVSEVGAYVLVFSPFPNEPSSNDEYLVKQRITSMVGLLRAMLGRNIAFDLHYENILTVKGSVTAATPGMEQPVGFGRPDMSESARLDFEKMATAIETWDRREAAMLALRWLDAGMTSSGVDAVIRLWIALEIIGMPDQKNVKPVVKLLASAYKISYEDAANRFLIGRLHGVRSAIFHDGYAGTTGGLIAGYLEAVFIDVLRELLGLPCTERCEAILSKHASEFEIAVREITPPRKQ